MRRRLTIVWVAAVALMATGTAAQDKPPIGTWKGDLQNWTYDETARQVIIDSDGSCRWGFVRLNHTPGKVSCSFDARVGRLTLTSGAGAKVEFNRSGDNWRGSFVPKGGYTAHVIEMMRTR